ncbi:hypothetical protein BJX96DRAFT_173295 [Aspergillus floccosus]
MALRPSFDSRAKDPRPTPALSFTPARKPTNNPTTPLLALTHHVQAQSTQAQHLFTQTSHLLSAVEREWIETTIADTESTTREILRLTESFRVEEAVRNGRVGVKSQLRWLLFDSRKAREKRERLVLCHTSLMGVLAQLQGLSLHGPQGQQRESLQGSSHPFLGELWGGEGDAHSGVTRAGMSSGRSGDGTATKSPVSSSSTATTYGSGSESGPRFHIGQQRPGSPHWDLAVQLQDAGMEAAVFESESKPELLCTKVPFSVASVNSSMVKLPVQERTRPSFEIGQ